jgi:membrane protein required for colicin V production
MEISQSLIWIDYAIVVVIAVSALIGLLRGFVKELSRLLTWLVIVLVWAHYGPDFARAFQRFSADPLTQLALACGGLLVAVLLLSALIQWILKDVILRDRLSIIDRVLGIAFGVGRGLLMVSVLLVMANLTAMPQSSWWTKSALIPRFQPFVSQLKDHLPDQWAGYLHR